MMPMLKHFGVGVIPWGPLGGGCEYTPGCIWASRLSDRGITEVDHTRARRCKITLILAVLCRPYKDLQATTRSKGLPKDGRGQQVSPGRSVS